jgi:hypothetical protein
MTKRKLIIWIPLAALLVNAVIYFIVSNVRSSPSAVVAGDATRQPGIPAAPGLTHETRADNTKDKEHLADDKQAEQKSVDDEKTAFARRAIGLAALEAGDYDKALINFTEARALLGDKAQVGDLLRVTEELRNHPGAGPHRPKATPPTPAALPQRAITRAGPPHRVATKEVAPAVESSPAVEATPGLLIVTTTPRGLLVQVDDTPLDLTPMRSKVSAGSHRLALLDGDRKIYESTFAMKEGATATVVKDLSAEVVAERKPAAAPVAAFQAPPVAPSTQPSSGLAKSERDRDEAQSPELVPAAALEAPPSRPRMSPFPGPNTGALAISSPGLYGVVWVNGRPRGYPPVEISDMPAGPIKVEVRVNGIEKRSSTVVVQPGVTTAVTLSSRATAP